MLPILTPEQMRFADRYAIETLHISPAILMEGAARAAFERIYPHMKSHAALSHRSQLSIVILCGSGNNGGDGFALARLFSHYADVRVVWIGAKEKMTPETRMNFDLLATHIIPTLHCTSETILAKGELQRLLRDADCVLDALIGNGGTEHLRGVVVDILREINATRRSDRLDIAIDIPTGLNAETGKAHVNCFRAEITVSLAALKTGLLLNNAPEYVGQCITVPIGIPADFLNKQATVRVIEEQDKERMFQARPRNATKHDFGSVAIIGGTLSMPGAPALAANACIAAGAGLVKMFTPSAHSAVFPEVMTKLLRVNTNGSIARENIEILQRSLEKHSVFVIGPGLGKDEETLAVIREIIARVREEQSVVIDADGLRAVQMDTDMFLPLHPHTVLTPHRGEFARMTGINYTSIPDNAHTLASQWAAKLGCTVLLKNVPTIISNGTTSFWNTSGNAGMATAGSGDVLAGIIGAFLAQRNIHGWDFTETVAMAAYCHGLAGDFAAAALGQQNVTASSIIRYLSDVFPKFQRPHWL